MKKVIFLFFALLSFKSIGCGPYVSGTSISPIFSLSDPIQQNQMFVFQTRHYSDKYKSYGRHYKMFLQNTASMQKVLLTEQTEILSGVDKNNYVALKASEQLDLNSVYQFIIEIDGQEIEFWSSEINCFATHRPLKVRKLSKTEAQLIQINHLNKYNNMVSSVSLTTTEKQLYKVTINTPGKSSKAYFQNFGEYKSNINIMDLTDDTSISLTQIGPNGKMIVTQYLNVADLRKWTTEQNS